MAGTIMLSRGGREEQDQAGLALVWGYEAGVMEGGDVATVINSLSEGGAKDIAKVGKLLTFLASVNLIVAVVGGSGGGPVAGAFGRQRQTAPGVLQLQVPGRPAGEARQGQEPPGPGGKVAGAAGEPH